MAQLNDLRRKALMDSIDGIEPEQEIDPTPKVELPPPAGALPGPEAAPTASAPPARDFSRLVGYDAGKFNDPNKQSAKYQMGRTLSQFDSTKGLTPEVIAALNGLGFGTFSGQGDKLSLAGLTDAGKAAGLVGDYRDADFNVGFKTGNGKWGYQDPAYEALNPPSGGGAPAGGFGGAPLDAALSGDPNATLQRLLQQMSGSRPNFEALLAQLGGG